MLLGVTCGVMGKHGLRWPMLWSVSRPLLVVQQIYDIFGLNCALCIKSMKFGMLVQLTKENIFRYGGVAAAPLGGRWRQTKRFLILEEPGCILELSFIEFQLLRVSYRWRHH